MPLLLFYHEFLSVLDIDTLGESFCRICMFANQFALDAVDVIAPGLICLDMANASIDGSLSRLKLLLMCFRFSFADVR